jgi:hypothetical protein
MARHRRIPSSMRPFLQLAQALIGEETVLCIHQDRRLIREGRAEKSPHWDGMCVERAMFHLAPTPFLLLSGQNFPSESFISPLHNRVGLQVMTLLATASFQFIPTKSSLTQNQLPSTHVHAPPHQNDNTVQLPCSLPHDVDCILTE